MPLLHGRLAIPMLAAALVAVACARGGGRSESPDPSASAQAGQNDASVRVKGEDQTALSTADFISRGQPNGTGGGTRGANVPGFWVRSGYKVDLVAKAENARFMVFDDKGHLFLSRPNKGDILVFGKSGDGSYKQSGTFAADLPTVHGMYYKDGWLWFTQSGSVHKAKVNANGTAGERVTVLSGLPEGGHFWRPILVVEDGFFTSIGDSGNITDETAKDRQKIWKYSLDGKNRTLWASGIRNTEKYFFRPGTKELWGMDHGSDWFGGPLGDKREKQPITDMNPPDEFNRYLEGGFYGHPFVVGDRVPRYESAQRPDIIDLAAKTIPPAWKFGAHWAANGWTFINSSNAAPKGDAVCAMHGSWNDSVLVGYRLEQVMFDEATGLPMGARMLVGTLGPDRRPLARPVDVVEEPGGALLWTDDQNGAIYRLSKTK